MSRTQTVHWSLAGAVKPLARSSRAMLAGVRNVAVRWTGVPAGREIRVSYGHCTLPRARDYTHGGIVKLQSLAGAFANTRARFNLLYLVSSRLPHDSVGLADSAHRKGAKIVVNQNGVAYPGWHGPGWERVNAPLAAVLHRADHVFYQSAFCKLSADRFLGSTSAPSEILYNPVETCRFVPAPSNGRGMTLLMAGTQDLHYKVTTAIDVVARLAERRVDVRLLITGRLCWTTDERAATRVAAEYAHVRRVADRVTFLGPYSQADAPSIYQRADVLLHPKYNDPCPGVVIEALACGLPIVYSSSGGVPELVGNEAGIGVPAPTSWEREYPPSPDAMADAVVEAFERRAQLGAAARQRAVERFDVEPWVERHRSVFTCLVA